DSRRCPEANGFDAAIITRQRDRTVSRPEIDPNTFAHRPLCGSSPSMFYNPHRQVGGVMRQDFFRSGSGLRILALVLIVCGGSGFAGQGTAKGRWVGTWAPAVPPRVDPPPATPSPQNAAPNPGAGRAVQPGPQTLPDGQPIPATAQSMLHFNNQTLRQIV